MKFNTYVAASASVSAASSLTWGLLGFVWAVAFVCVVCALVQFVKDAYR